jgi:hypothetical protein
MTTIPSVDTFEHDIVNEIRQKEASITDIASAVSDIGNTPVEITSKQPSILIGSIVILILCGVVGAGYAGYIYYTQGAQQQVATLQKKSSEQNKNSKGLSLQLLSPTLAQSLGTSLSNAEKTSAGYTLSIISYPAVFSYMLKNESAFGSELGKAVGNTVAETKAEIIASTTPTTPITGTSSPLISTSTQTSATGTMQIPEEVSIPTEYIFSDITISNQNMRVATTAYGTVAYAFIGTQKLVISSSTEGILSLRNNILHK